MDDVFAALQKSSFRQSFHLRRKDLAYLQQKGFPTVLSHAEDFIRKRLQPAVIANDGRQTPFKGPRYLWRSMPPPAAVAAASRNGTAFHKGEHSKVKKWAMC